MLLWQGLGYYSRARNLHVAAKIVMEKFKGVFPVTFKELKTLKGIGDYTAAAIASIANNEPVAVLDGNVYRVLSRLFAIYEPVDIPKNKKMFLKLAENLLLKDCPGTFNQAIMELGALVCTPKQPKCAECPLEVKCLAYLSKTVSDFPVKRNKTKQRNRYFYYLIISDNEQTIIQKRNEKDIWEGLYQFPLVESKRKMANEHILTIPQLKEILESGAEITKISGEIKHVLSHQVLIAQFIHIEGRLEKLIQHDTYKKIIKSEIADFPMPRLITRYLEKSTV